MVTTLLVDLGFDSHLSGRGPIVSLHSALGLVVEQVCIAVHGSTVVRFVHHSSVLRGYELWPLVGVGNRV